MAPPPIQSRWAQSLEESDTNSDYDNSNDNHNDDNNNNNNMMNQTDGAAEIDIDDQTRHRNMVAVQMLDLGSSRRENITATEAGPRCPYGSMVSQRSLLTNRRVNQEDTPESEAFQQNKATIQGWNSYHTSVKDEDFEKLDSLMNGQSHRARLNETLQQVGGQRDYFERGGPARANFSAGSIPRGGSALHGGRGGGTAGSRGHGGRGGFQLSAGRPTPVSGSGYRPLDPAVEDDREYGYKSSRSGNRSRRGADRPQVSVIGNTVRLSSTASSRPMARPLRGVQQPAQPARRAPPVTKPPPPPKRASPATDQSSKWDMLLDPAAFMKAISATRDRETLNQEAPPAAPSKTPDAAKKEPAPKNPKKSSPEEQREQLQQVTEPAPRMTNVPRSEIRQVPTNEFMFPPPVVTTNQEANDAAYTDGVPSPASFCSAQTSQMQSPEPSAAQSSAPFVFEGNNEGPVVGLGIEGLPDSTKTGNGPASQHATSSAAAADLMDQDIVDFSQDALSPVSAVGPGPVTPTVTATDPPPFIEVNGIRYYHEEALPSQSSQRDAAASSSDAATQDPALDAPAPTVVNPPESATRVANVIPQSRVVTNSGYTIGGILGDHNLPGRHRVDSVVQTTPTLESRWAATSRATSIPRSSRPNVSNTSRPGVTPAAPTSTQLGPARDQVSPARRLRSTDASAPVPAGNQLNDVAPTVPASSDAPIDGPVVEGSGWHRLSRPTLDSRSISASTNLSHNTQAQVQVPDTVAIGDQNLPGRARGNSVARDATEIESRWSSPAMTAPADSGCAQRAIIDQVNNNSTIFGDHNLPGQGGGETSGSSSTKVQSKWASSAMSNTKQLKALSPPSSVLPQRVNPFASSTSTPVAEDVRPTSTSRTSATVSAHNHARSKWGDPSAVVQMRNDSSAHHLAEPLNPFAEPSRNQYNAASAGQPTSTRAPAEPVLDCGEPLRSSAAITRSPDVTISGTSLNVASRNTTSVAQPPTETYEQRLVRAMNSSPATGMTPFGGTQSDALNRGRPRTLGNSLFRRRNVRTQPGPGFTLLMETNHYGNSAQPAPAASTRPLSENTTRANKMVASSARGTAAAAKDAESSSGESEL